MTDTPDGWQLVPKEATEMQMRAGYATYRLTTNWKQTYAAMLAAAPQPPAFDTDAATAGLERGKTEALIAAIEQSFKEQDGHEWLRAWMQGDIVWPKPKAKKARK